MVLDTAADQLLDADADGSGPRLSHPARRATPAHPATLSPAAAATARRKPPVPPATRVVTAAAARALQGSARHFAVDAGAAAATAAAGASSPPLQPTAGLAAPSQVCPSITADGCGADGSSAEATAAGIESAETGAGGGVGAGRTTVAGAMLGGEAEGGTLPPLSAQRLPQRVINPLVLEQAEVRRPASRIEERTACRETLLLSCCAPAAPSSPCPARPHTSDTFPGGSLTACAAADGATSAGRSGPAAAATGIDFDCVHADRVAILPTAAHATLDQMFQQSAAAIIGRVKAERETTLRERVPPCVVPRRFGWTDPDKYDDAEVQLRVARADELSERERERYVKRAAARGQLRLVEALQQRTRPADSTQGRALFQKAAMLTRIRLACSKHSEVQLPLEVDEEAPPLHGKMAHPSLADVNYMLNRWAHAWDRQRDIALRARAAKTTLREARPATPFKSLRALEPDLLYGYPIAPES